MAIRCIADDSAADHGHKRCDSPPQALFSQALCVGPMSQHHNRAQRSPCDRLHLASSLERQMMKGCLLPWTTLRDDAEKPEPKKKKARTVTAVPAAKTSEPDPCAFLSQNLNEC